MSNGLSQEAALVGKITEYQSSVKYLIGTEEQPVNFNLLTPGVYVFQGYMSATAAEKTTTNVNACPKELLLVREVLIDSDDQGDGRLLEAYAKVGYLFHTDFGESIFSNDQGAGVLACMLMPSSYKFIGEWPEDTKKEIIAVIENSRMFEVMWIDKWLEDSSGDYATRDYVDSSINGAVTDMATQTYVRDAISSAIGGITFPSDMATQTYVNETIDTKLGVIENGSY